MYSALARLMASGPISAARFTPTDPSSREGGGQKAPAG